MKHIRVDSELVKITLDELGEEKEISICRADLKVTYFRELRSYPVASHLKFITNDNTTEFKHFENFDWSRDVLLEIKDYLDSE